MQESSADFSFLSFFFFFFAAKIILNCLLLESLALRFVCPTAPIEYFSREGVKNMESERDFLAADRRKLEEERKLLEAERMELEEQRREFEKERKEFYENKIAAEKEVEEVEGRVRLNVGGQVWIIHLIGSSYPAFHNNHLNTITVSWIHAGCYVFWKACHQKG